MDNFLRNYKILAESKYQKILRLNCMDLAVHMQNILDLRMRND